MSITFFFRLVIVACFLQLVVVDYSYAQREKRGEFENLSIVEDSIGKIMVFENNSYKNHGVGLKRFLDDIEGENCDRVVMLNNNVPQLMIRKVRGEWSVSYDVDDVWKVVKGAKQKNRSLFKVDIVVYPELLMRNIKLERVYDVVFNLSPAVEISLWKGMMVTAQIIFPVVNTYGDRYGDIRPGFVTLSQDVRLPRNWFMQATVGLFSRERMGVDLKVFHPFRNQRFAIRGQVGLTGPYSYDDWVLNYGVPRRLTWSVGGQYYNPLYNLQFNVDAGRYIGKDYGVRGDVTRHFKHVSIGLFAIKSNKGSFGAGFNFAISLPPYRQSRRGGVRVRTADYFFMEYNGVNENFYRNIYKTSPGENRAYNNFNTYYVGKTLKKNV